MFGSTLKFENKKISDILFCFLKSKQTYSFCKQWFCQIGAYVKSVSYLIWFPTTGTVKYLQLKSIIDYHLTPNTPLIHTSFTYSKWNMGEICGLKFHLWYVHTSQKVLLKSLHAQRIWFLLLNLHLMQKSPFLWSKKDFPKKALRIEEFQNNFF